MASKPSYKELEQRVRELEKITARREMEERRRTEKALRTLFNISNAVSADSSLDDLYRSIHGYLDRIIEINNFYIALYDKKRDSVTFPYCVDRIDGLYEPIENISKKTSLTGLVIKSEQPILLKKEKIQDITRSAENVQTGTDSAVWLGVPLKVKNEVMGVMAIQSYTDPERYGKKDIDLLHSVSDQVALAIERKRSEDALGRSEARTRAFLNAITEASLLLDIDGTVLGLNGIAAERMGKSRKEIAGNSLNDFFPPDTTKFRKAQIDDVVENKAPVRFNDRRDGRVFDSNLYPVFDGEGNVVQIAMFAMDITDKLRVDEEQLKVQKLESLGVLAGGIAHEFNNALFGIMGNIDLLKLQLLDDAKVDKYIGKMKNAAMRMTRLTDQLLAYAKGGKYEPGKISLRDLVENGLLSSGSEIYPAIRIEKDFVADFPFINADATQIQMVFSGVMSNAADSMNGKGRIKVSVSIENIGEREAMLHHNVRPGKFACLTIEDNGKGMDKETMDRIFEPFFTTKFQGRGLGMAAAYGIVKSHDGWIDVDSKPGKGTTVRVFLPESGIE